METENYRKITEISKKSRKNQLNQQNKALEENRKQLNWKEKIQWAKFTQVKFE
jgi:hypothetical protein